MTRAKPREYLYAVAAVAAATAISFAALPFLHPTNLVMLYILGTVAVSARGQRGPAAVACVLSVVAFDVCFVPPRFKISVDDAEYLVTFVAMFATAMIISQLTIRFHSEAALAREGERRTKRMHEFGQRLSALRRPDEVLDVAAAQIGETFTADVVAFVPGADGKVRPHKIVGEWPDDKDTAVAQWVFDQGRPAGLGTDSLPTGNTLFVPMQPASGSAGVFGLRLRCAEALSKDQRLLLDALLPQVGLALEVGRLEERNKRTEIDRETERLRSALLSSVSHDFRTPLTAIVGSASALLAKDEIQKSRAAKDLAENIQEEGERLSRLVQNLLEATRLEAGGVQIKKELYPLEEVVGAALERLSKRVGDRHISVSIPNDFPPVAVDPVLMQQVFLNLLENAIHHTSPGDSIEIVARRDGPAIEVSVADHGAGIKPAELERVFEKFFREPTSHGAGLGLAICRAVITAHGGKIWAENRIGGGAIFRFMLPLESSHVR